MILFPAIDLKDGQCVRLELGQMDRATIFNEDPAAQAMTFEKQGFRWLHVVDLDGAFAGKPVNAVAVECILAAVNIPVQLGGGIRELAQLEAWLARGVARAILGTVALKSPNMVREACRRFPGKIAVAIDAKAGRVAVEGWAKTTDMTAVELGKRVEDAGVTAIIFTDIDRDGVLSGLNIDSTLMLARETNIPVIASGGLASIADVARLLEPDCAILEGAISGRALYDGRLDAETALRMIAERANP
jgi:phosphoribosylformimino-5-aminoimidazole carboxamide ribotide isomerase